MKRSLTICLTLGTFTWSVMAEQQYALKTLPPAVQKTIREEAKSAEIRKIGKETEHGVAQYEVETLLNGKHHDFNVDTKGVLLLVEDEITLDAVPALAKASILKKVADGKIGLVETFKRGGETMYEASYTKNGKKHEVLVKADGTETKN